MLRNDFAVVLGNVAPVAVEHNKQPRLALRHYHQLMKQSLSPAEDIGKDLKSETTPEGGVYLDTCHTGSLVQSVVVSYIPETPNTALFCGE